jgi:hypothetical protein
MLPVGLPGRSFYQDVLFLGGLKTSILFHFDVYNQEQELTSHAKEKGQAYACPF